MNSLTTSTAIGRFIEPPERDQLIRGRKAAAAALQEYGYPVNASSLAMHAFRNDGPVYRSFGRATLFRLGDLLDWAQARMSRPKRGWADVTGIDCHGSSDVSQPKFENPQAA